MRYGFCHGFFTQSETKVDYDFIKMIKEAGFDFVEVQATIIESLTDEEFEEFAAFLEELDLDCDCSSSLFPRTIRVTGKDIDEDSINNFLEKTFSRLKRLGAKKVVLGSAPSRALDDETSEDEGYEQIAKVCRELVVPACEKYDITVVIEPLGATACNFINTLPDGMKVVNAVNHPRIELLCDTVHMTLNEDDPDDVVKFKDNLKHVHIAELNRMLPEDDYSVLTKKVIENLVKTCYEGTISFESRIGEGVSSMKKALALLKKTLNK